MGNAPCRGCQDRVVGCHSTCEKYLEFCKQLEAARREERNKYAGPREPVNNVKNKPKLTSAIFRTHKK